MRRFRVRGLLDRPSSQSLGMLGLVIEREDGGLSVEGVTGASGRTVDLDRFRDLLAAGDARETSGPRVDGVPWPYTALWVGHEFASQAERFKVPTPPLPRASGTLDGQGSYWVGPAQHVWRVLDAWLVLAFRRAVRDRNVELANLMAWTMPEREETRAALWYTMHDHRKGNLDWWVKLDRDHGNRRATVQDLEKRLRDLSEASLSRRLPKVFGFCAPAKGGDNEVADALSQQLRFQRLSFGRWLRVKVKEEGGEPTRRVLQQKGQQMIEQRGALEFCLELLSALPPNVSIAEANLVVDGIRHEAVRESLKALIGEDRFELVVIQRPDDVRRKLLIEEEHVPPGEVDAVLNDPTEREVSGIARRATRVYDRQQGVQPITMALAGVT